MFAEIMEYEKVLDEIVASGLSEAQVSTLLTIIADDPTISTNKLIEITDELKQNDHIILDAGTYSVDPIMNESTSINLLEVAIPIIIDRIPREVICHLTETHAKRIVDGILSVEFDEHTTRKILADRIDEMVSSGDISIPVQGLRRRPETFNVVLNGVFTHLLNKNIKFGSEILDRLSKQHNKKVLKNAVTDYVTDSEETPLSALLPKFYMKLRNLTGEK